MKQPKIKSMKYEDFKDNEYLEQLRANGTDIIVGCLDDLINWGRSNSVWPLTFATSCCGIEFMAVGAARYDFARFGFEVARAGCNHRCRYYRLQNGSGITAVVRSDGRTQICHRYGGMCHIGRTVQEILPCRKRCKSNITGRCLCSRLSSPS